MGIAQYDLRGESTDRILKAAVESKDRARPRSQQTLVGASELGGCRRQVFYRLVGHEAVNETNSWAAIKGTAVHSMIERAFQHADPEGERFLVEVEVPGAAGMGPGHIDLVDLKRRRAIDWKTTLKSKLKWFPKEQQRWQVQVYGELLTRAGYEIDTVELVAIPLDGEISDIRIHTEPRDPAVAAQAFAWLEQLSTDAANGEIPEPERYGNFCASYCPFYGPFTCQGKF